MEPVLSDTNRAKGAGHRLRSDQTRGQRASAPSSLTGSRPTAFLLFILACGIPWVLTSCRPPAPSYEGYAYLILAPQALTTAVDDFAAYKEAHGFLVDRVTLEEIVVQSPGDDDAEKIRNYLTGYSARTPEQEFVLLIGSMATLPMRLAYPHPFDRLTTVPTDFYYEELTGNWDADGDGYFGEYGDDLQQGADDYIAELWAGRIPWDDPGEVRLICGNMISYEEDATSRKKQAMAAAATIATPCDTSILVKLAEAMVFAPSGYRVVSLCEDCPAANPDLELTQANFLGQWQGSNPGSVFLFSHGNPYGACYSHDPYYFVDSDHLPQAARPAAVIGLSCSIGAPDWTPPSLGRLLVRDLACAAFLGAGRDTYYGHDPVPVLASGILAAGDLIKKRLALGEAKTKFIEYYAAKERVPDNLPGYLFHQNLFLHMLYGDPSLQFR